MRLAPFFFLTRRHAARQGKCILRDQAERISLDAQFIEDLLETAAGRLLGRSSEALEGSALRSGCKVTGNL